MYLFNYIDLTNTDITSLEAETKELNKLITELTAILGNEKTLLNVIKKELKEIKRKYADARRTVIEDEISEIKINLEVMIPSEDVIVTITKEGYMKRTSLRSYSASNGRDLGMKESDRLLLLAELNTIETLLIFTNKGNYVYMPIHELPDIRWKDLGQHVAAIVPISRDEEIIKVIPVKEFEEGKNIMIFTKDGMIKKSELKALSSSALFSSARGH